MLLVIILLNIESRDMYSKSDHFEIMRGSNTNEIIRDLFNSIEKISRFT